jgi:hypothetical protein
MGEMPRTATLQATRRSAVNGPAKLATTEASYPAVVTRTVVASLHRRLEIHWAQYREAERGQDPQFSQEPHYTV